MLYLFLGMALGGIGARVTLLSHRGGWFLEDQSKKSMGLVIFEILATAAGIAAFIIGFMLFPWWMPFLALSIGYWFIAPFVVTRSTYPFFYQTQAGTTLASLVCSSLLIATYFKII